MKMRTKMKLIPLVIAAASAAGPGWAQNGITDMGVLVGQATSTAYGISADGSVVVGESNNGLITNDGAFRWTAANGMQGLGTLNAGDTSAARAISSDGNVIVGSSEDGAAGNASRAFRWTQPGGMVALGVLNGGSQSFALGLSADGTVVAGWSADGAAGNAHRAFRWTQAGGMASLGVLNGGNLSEAFGVSADGNVIVGTANDGTAGNATRAFRWTQAEGITSLGALNGGTYSKAIATSADGGIVVGSATDGVAANAVRAFRWTQAGGMVSLGTLNGGTSSGLLGLFGFGNSIGVSTDGRVVVGQANNGAAANVLRAFRWTQATGMQTVEDWLRASGVTVPSDITQSANATNSDGSVVVGSLTTGHAFIARGGSGLVTLADVQQSLGAAATGGGMALSAVGTALNGAHSRPLARRVAAGKKAFWVAGDWGTDDHGSRSGDLGLAEVGLGQNFGPLQLSLSLGQTWAKQDLILNGRAKSDGTYVMAEALVPLRMDTADSGLIATVGAYVHRGDADLRRGYLNAGFQDFSSGMPGVDTWGLRARLDWENASTVAGAGLTPYVDLGYNEAKIAAYTETGGGFPAQFNARKETATELRLGMNASKPILNNARLVGTLEAVHRFEDTGARTVGQVVGLFGFDLAGPAIKQDWLRGGVGIEGKLGDGTGSLMLNLTTQGEAPNAWLAASWQMAF